MSGPNGFDDNYQTVAERIRIFREKHPEGSLRPLDPAFPFRLVVVNGSEHVVVTAAAYRHPEDKAPGVGQAWQVIPGLTEYERGNELMIAETSAFGRAIVASLAADTVKIASADEVKVAKNNRSTFTATPPANVSASQVAQAVKQELAVDPVAHVEAVPPAAPSVTPAEDEDGNRAVVAEAIRLIKDPGTSSDELRNLWQVLNQARLLAWRVPAEQGIDADGDGQVPLGSLVAFVGRARG